MQLMEFFIPPSGDENRPFVGRLEVSYYTYICVKMNMQLMEFYIPPSGDENRAFVGRLEVSYDIEMHRLLCRNTWIYVQMQI